MKVVLMDQARMAGGGNIYANDALWLSTFVSITGFIYAVVSAFAIAHVWEKFNSLSDEVRKEAASLKNIAIFS